MKKFCSFLLLLLITGGSLFAQENINEVSMQDPSDEIWGKNQKNKSGNSNVLKWSPPPPSTAAPIDGGVLLLLGAGVLYGRKRLTKKAA